MRNEIGILGREQKPQYNRNCCNLSDHFRNGDEMIIMMRNKQLVYILQGKAIVTLRIDFINQKR